MRPSAAVHTGRTGRVVTTLIVGLTLILASCGTQPPPATLTLSSVTAVPGQLFFYDLSGEHIRGDAAVYVCDVEAPEPAVVTATGDIVPGTSRAGVVIRFRMPYLGPVQRDCDVRVEQPSADGVEVAALATTLAYTPPLALSDLVAVNATPNYDLFGANIRGDAAVFVCNVRAAAAVVRDADGEIVGVTSRAGAVVRFRVPDLGSDALDCEVRVEQRLGDEVEVAVLATTLAFSKWMPLEGKRVLVYTSIYSGNSERNPRARFDAAILSVEDAEGLNLTIVDGSFQEYFDGDVALRFRDRLVDEEWDAVVFIEEQWDIPRDVLQAISSYLTEDSGRALGSYWLPFEDSRRGARARTFAASFGAVVTPDDNVTPVDGGRVGITFSDGLAQGLSSAQYELVNDGFYVASYATRLDPAPGAISLCDYLDAANGSCAVGNSNSTSLYLGFTLAPLAGSTAGSDLEVLLSNALRYVILDDVEPLDGI